MSGNKNRYEIIRKLGEGGMGEVYLVRDKEAGMEYAMKLAKGEPGCAARLALRNEAERMRQLKDRRIPYIAGCFEEEDETVLLMEYVRGISLEEYIRTHAPLTEAEAQNIMKKLCGVIGYLHMQSPQIVYRDIKPSNFIIDGEEIRLIDFGTSLAGYGDIKSRTIGGTLGYAPPEQLSGEQLGASADVYALGAVFIYMLTGCDPAKPPYHVLPPSEWPADLSAAGKSLILDCLSEDARQRPDNAAVLAGRLEKISPGKEGAVIRIVTALYHCLMAALFFLGFLVTGGRLSETPYVETEKFFLTTCAVFGLFKLAASLTYGRHSFIIKREWNVIYTEKKQPGLLL